MTNPSRPHLPLEILDYTIDFLHNDQEALKQCCLTSKSWIPRSRKYLFAEIAFRSVANLESWKRTFPDYTNSPAYYTHTLVVGCPEAVEVVDAGEDGWIRAFSGIATLEVLAKGPNKRGTSYPSLSLTPFHGFSPVLKSLSINCGSIPNVQVFDLLSTLPLLEDLFLSADGLYEYSPSDSNTLPTVLQYYVPPLTGTLSLLVYEGIGATARRMLRLPNGLHFRRLSLSWLREKETQWVNALVAACSNTLSHLIIDCCFNRALIFFLHYLNRCSPRPAGTPHMIPIDLSKATRLRDICFKLASLAVEWVIQALQTITRNHVDFRSIDIRVSYIRALAGDDANPRQVVEEQVRDRWSELDRLLVQFRDSRSICLGLSYRAPTGQKEKMEECMRFLLPEVTREGSIYSLEWYRPPGV